MEIITFLREWQNLVGSIIGAFLAIFGAFLTSLWIRRKDRIRDEKKHYTNILLTLNDLQLFISRCETLLGAWKEKQISFNKIVINNEFTFLESCQILKINYDVQKSLILIYKAAEVIKSHLDKAEISITTKQFNGDKVVQEKTLVGGQRYGIALNFIKCYLKRIYKEFNNSALEVKSVSKRKKHKSFWVLQRLEFPKSIFLYNHDHVESMTLHHGLEDKPLDDIERKNVVS